MTEQPTSPVPNSFSKGETLVFNLAPIGFTSANGYTLKYYFRGESHHDIDGVAAGDNWTITIPANTITGTGNYWFEAYAIKGSERIKVDAGRCTVTVDFAAITTAYDGRDPIEKILANIDAMLSGNASLQVQMYTIGNRQLSNYKHTELTELRSYYANLLAGRRATDRINRSGRFFRTLRVIMRRAS